MVVGDRPEASAPDVVDQEEPLVDDADEPVDLVPDANEADVLEQHRLATPSPRDDIPSISRDASEADALEQAAGVPADEDERAD